MRLINADALKALFEEDGHLSSYIEEYIDSAPTIEAEPVRHGRWVNPRMNKYGHPCHSCSECGFLASQKDRNFCPNCGAKMDEED